MATEGLNHINIAAPTELLARVRDFYVDVVGLRDGSRPEFGIRGYWLYAGENAVVHLMVKDGPQQGPAKGFLDHIAFTCSDLEGMEQRLAGLGVAYRKNDFRQNGIIQLFIEDPTGLGVELNFPVQ